MYKEKITIAVIGAGIIGLTTAIELLEAGYKNLTIYTKEQPPYKTNSDIAGAIWRPWKAYPEAEFEQWCLASLEKFKELSEIPASGIKYITAVEFFKTKEEIPAWVNAVAKVARPDNIVAPEGYPHYFAVSLPVAQTPIYRKYLFTKFKNLGGKIETRAINNLAELTSVNNIVINCTGEQARFLTNDNDVHPVRGQVVCVEAPQELNFYIGSVGDDITYIIPRPDLGEVILGGVYQENDTDLNIRANETKAILARAIKIYPALADAKIIAEHVGLRCARSSVRLEAEKTINSNSIIIHNYGHGGSAYTASWGCAKMVLSYCNGFIA